MTRVLISTLALVTMATGCPEGGTTDATDAQCLTTYTMFPEDGASRAYYRTTVDAIFNEAVPGATLTLTDADGNAVAGSAAVDAKNDKRLVFQPETPLAPGATYTAAVAFDCEGASQGGEASWTVSEVGAATDEGGLIGNDYALSLASARFIRPDAVGDIIGDFLTFDILMSIKSIENSQLTVFGAVGDEDQQGVQAECSPTIDFPPADFSENPYFELGPQKLEIEVEGTEVTIEDLFLAGSFAPDGSYIDGVVLAGIVDTRPFAPLIEDDPDAPPEAVCEVTGRLGIPCVACPDGTGDFCLEILADSIAADSDGVQDLVEIPDPCALEACAGSDDCQQ